MSDEPLFITVPRCADWYDGPEPRPGTHTCDLPAGHHGPHHCPTCGMAWDG